MNGGPLMHPLSLVLFGLVAQDPEPTVEHRFDLRPLELLARASFEDFDPRRPLEEPFLSQLEFDSEGYDLTLDDDLDDVERVWREIVPNLATRFLGRAIDARVEGHELVIEGDHRARSATRSALAVVERWLGRAWVVELIELPRGALDAVRGPVLTPSEVDALLTAHPPVRWAQRRATTRRAARFQREHQTPLLSDYDIEVTNGGMGSADPVVYVMRWGSDALVWLEPHLDGRVHVSCIWRAGEPLGEPRRSYVYGEDHPPVELARGSSARRVGSAFLVDGAAFVLGDGADEARDPGHARGALLVRLRVMQDNRPRSEDVIFLGLGAASFTRTRTRPARLHEPQPSGLWPTFPDSLDLTAADGFAQVSREGGVADLSAMLDEVRGEWKDIGLEATIERFGTEAIVAGPPEALGLARARLATRIEPYTHTYTVELRTGVVTAQAGRGLILGLPIEPSHPAFGELTERRLGALVPGDRLELTSCNSWMYLQDVDLELGRGIDMGDPISAVVESGSVVVAEVVSGVEGQLVLALQFVERHVAPPPFPTSVAASLRREFAQGVVTTVCDLERPVSTGRKLAEVASMSPGVWTVLGLEDMESPANEPPRTRVVAVRVDQQRGDG